jgi:5,6,7,8-tetrahydromethanopterin hydro-lyase
VPGRKAVFTPKSATGGADDRRRPPLLCTRLRNTVTAMTVNLASFGRKRTDRSRDRRIKVPENELHAGTAAEVRACGTEVRAEEPRKGRSIVSESPAVLIGESFVGDGAEAAHINTGLGLRSGPVGTAWATALATPSAGHAPFVAVLRPGLPVKPPTLFVNKAAIASAEHGTLTWGAAQAGVAGGVADADADGIIQAQDVDELVLIAAVWVNPAATDADLVYSNNRAATTAALRAASRSLPELDEMLAARTSPANPFYEPT